MEEVFGLKNNSTLCYINSLVQALLSCDAFVQALISSPVMDKVHMELLSIVNDDDTVRDASRLQRSIKGLSEGQGSASEAMCLLIDTIRSVMVRASCIIIKKEELICMECKRILSTKKDIGYQQYIFDIDYLKKYGLEKTLSDHRTICKDYKKEEEHCKCDAECMLRTRIEGVPSVVTLVLNRYFDKTSYKGISFPSTIKLNGNIYNKVSEIYHRGTLEGGHYVSSISRSGRWYILDDERVFSLSKGPSETSYAYMIFYNKA